MFYLEKEASFFYLIIFYIIFEVRQQPTTPNFILNFVPFLKVKSHHK